MSEPRSIEPRSTTERFAAEPRITDVQTLKAFTHPLRMRIIEYLNDREAATSTTLAKHLGESTGQTSYHLRQLAKYGFVEEVEGMGTARERWWKSGGLNIPAEEVQSLAQQSPLVGTLAEHQVRNNAARLLEFFRRIPEEESEWTSASAITQIGTQLTVDELIALRDEIWDVCEKHTEAAQKRRDEGETEGRRRVRINFAAFPLPLEESEDPGE